MAKFTGKYEQTIQAGARFTGAPRVSSVTAQFWGRTTVGSTFNTIAAPAAAADSIIFLTLRNIVVGSEVGAREMSVLSVNPGVGFVAGPTNSCNYANSYTLNWFILNPQ